MKEILQIFSKIDPLNVSEFPVSAEEKRVSADVIIARLDEKTAIPKDIIHAIANISHEEMKLRSAKRTFKIYLYARSRPNGKDIKRWFDKAEVTDSSTGQRIKVSLLKKEAEALTKKKHSLEKQVKRFDKYTDPNVKLSKKQIESRNNLEARIDNFQQDIFEEEKEFLSTINLIYLCIASDRK